MAPSSTQVSLHLCSPRDIRSCFALVSTTFGTHTPFVELFNPRHNTAAGFEQAVARMERWHALADPEVTHFVAAKVDPSPPAVTTTTTAMAAGEDATAVPNGGIVGFAIWSFMHAEQPARLDDTGEDVEAVWSPVGGESECRLVRQVWREYVGPRNSVIRESGGRGAWVLELLCVHPGMQRRGIGEKLVRYGTDGADSHKVEAVVESTREGRRCYEKCGFVKEIDPMVFNVDEEFNARTLPDILFMRRRPISLA